MTQDIVDIINPQGTSPVLLVCEHASNHVPARFAGLGLDATAATSHAAWDPGALAVSTHLSRALDARLVAAKVSRLVYDANRPPDAPDAIPVRSERFTVPGNAQLSDAARAERIATYYEPFRIALSAEVAARPAPVLVTIHSFTPIYNGTSRAVEIGILHDSDTRFADALLAQSLQSTLLVERNQPYGPQHGVTHTLREHALPHGHLNVMIEIRNDLIAERKGQTQIAELLTDWLCAALKTVQVAA